MGIIENLARIRSLIASMSSNVKIVGVTKYSDVPQIIEAINGGLDIVGENRVHVAAEKFPKLPRVDKHMIGHLQSNKVKLAVRCFDCIQTIDSVRIAAEISKRAEKMSVMLQVNVAGEKEKFGVSVDGTEELYDRVRKFENLDVVGLMTIAPNVEPEQTRPYFQKLFELNQSLRLPYLSMGMSNDYRIAIEEGSNMVRIGTAIFG